MYDLFDAGASATAIMKILLSSVDVGYKMAPIQMYSDVPMMKMGKFLSRK